jgi:hypothetical protein
MEPTPTDIQGARASGGARYLQSSLNRIRKNDSSTQSCIVDAPIRIIDRAQTNTFSQITFDIEAIQNGTFSLNVNGGPIEFTNVALSGNGANKFLLTGTAGETFNTLAFVFAPAVDDLKQFRLQAGSGNQIPEPASWAMMVVGFGGLGAVLRSKRRRQRLTFA